MPTTLQVSSSPQLPSVKPGGLGLPVSLNVGSPNIGLANDLSQSLSQFQNLPLDQRRLFGFGETPEQTTQRDAVRESLTRLMSLQEQMTKARAPSEATTNLDRIIQETQRSLERFTPSEFLRTQPGLQDVGISQPQLEREVAARREPIARALSDLLFSRSIISQQQQTNIQNIQNQMEGERNQTQIREALLKLSESQKLPEGIQSKLLENFLIPKAQKPFELSPGQTRYEIDPATGQYKATVQAPEREATELQLARLEIAQQNAETARDKADIQNKINEIRLQQIINSGNLTEDQRKAATKIQGAEDIGNQIEDSLREIKPEAFGLKARSTGLLRKGLAAIGFDPAVRAYEALRQSSIAPLARAISGEVGVLTDRDIERAEKLLPNVNETKEEVQRKLANLRKAIEDRRNAIINPASFIKTNLQDTKKVSKDPLGIR